jgi:hypothetical protein
MSIFLAAGLVWLAILSLFIAARMIAAWRAERQANRRFSLTPLAMGILEDPLETSMALEGVDWAMVERLRPTLEQELHTLTGECEGVL